MNKGGGLRRGGATRVRVAALSRHTPNGYRENGGRTSPAFAKYHEFSVFQKNECVRTSSMEMLGAFIISIDTIQSRMYCMLYALCSQLVVELLTTHRRARGYC